jgi:hypothetical protein
LLRGIALAVNQLLADFRGRDPAIQACGLEGRVRLELVVDEGADIVQKGGDVAVNSVRMAERAETFSSRHRRLA